ncbi:MAG: hypothetical protein ACOCWA_03840 [Bacteroidota bacterium]
MKAKLERKISVFGKLYDTLEKNLNKWGNIEQFKSSYDDFVKNLKKLEELIPVSKKDHEGIISDLKRTRAEVNSKIIPVSNLMDLYAQDKNKKSLKKIIDKTRRKLDKLSDSGLSEKVVELADYAEKTIEKENDKETKDNKLESYGLSLKHIKELKAENDKFIKLREKLRTQIKASREAYKDIPKLVKENDRIIRNRINKFMSIFRNTDPDFYAAYRLAVKDEKPVKAMEKKEATIKKESPTKETKTGTKQAQKATSGTKEASPKSTAKKATRKKAPAKKAPAKKTATGGVSEG